METFIPEILNHKNGVEMTPDFSVTKCLCRIESLQKDPSNWLQNSEQQKTPTFNFFVNNF